MYNILNLLIIILFLAPTLKAQYNFTDEIKLKCTTIKNQQRTGTCWSYATTSLIESDLINIRDEDNYDLSEMYIVRKIYEDKSKNYLLRQGKANFSQGSLSHDLFRIIEKDGIVPESVYSGKKAANVPHDHGEMEAVLKGALDTYLAQLNKKGEVSDDWQEVVNSILDIYLGEVPETFVMEGIRYTPKEYAEYLDLNDIHYQNLTSFTHHPFGEKIILELPDNYSNGAYLNVPIDKLEKLVDQALKKGYTVAWDGDVSEKGFSAREGIAVLPVDETREDLFTEPGEEIQVTQEMRQKDFFTFDTTDDHLMHIVGAATDEDGNEYYIIKNSWGEMGAHKGYIYMSKPYFRLKTVAVSMNNAAVDAM